MSGLVLFLGPLINYLPIGVKVGAAYLVCDASEVLYCDKGLRVPGFEFLDCLRHILSGMFRSHDDLGPTCSTLGLIQSNENFASVLCCIVVVLYIVLVLFRVVARMTLMYIWRHLHNSALAYTSLHRQRHPLTLHGKVKRPVRIPSVLYVD